MYQVLALKYRPQNFDEVVGQKHVTATLKNAILKERLHHAYLFTGVRGTGKTSLARIFAKSLNCEKGPTATPCNTCSNCKAITAGQFLDVNEIDGASHTSVDHIRELREQVKYLPAAGRYKIYIIDEVHMLSNAAFNALLKTLEEPPPHVLFFFATTESHKIPITILSRCQRFDLRRLSQRDIQGQLEKICQAEKVSFQPSALGWISRSAEGSMRDAQSFLDMAIGLCGDELKEEKILEMLGLVHSTFIEDLTNDCIQRKSRESLQKVEEIYLRGYDLRQIALQWVDYLHDLTILKVTGGDFLSASCTQERLNLMEETVSQVTLHDLQVIFQTVYRGAQEIFRSESPKILFDLLIVKILYGFPFQSLADLIGSGGGGGGLTSKISDKPQKAASVLPRPENISTQAKKIPSPATQVPAIDGEALLERALRKWPQVKAILDHALAKHWEENRLVLTFEEDSLWAEMMQEKAAKLSEAFAEEGVAPFKVVVSTEERSKIKSKEEPEETPQIKINDPLVQQALEILNAKVHEVKSYGHE